MTTNLRAALTVCDYATSPDEARERPSRTDWALSLAQAVANRADCTNRLVGAVILNSEGRVVSTGYNGAPPGKPGCLTAGACPRSTAKSTPLQDYEGTACIALHAELNACIDAGRPRAKGCTIYVTCEPCYMCRLVIEATGLARAVWPDGEWILSTQDGPA